MKYILLFILCCSASVTINSDKQIIVSKNEQVTRVMVCSSLKHTRKTIDTSVGCSTPGFIQYAIKDNLAIHPHPERVADDHYYVEIHVRSNGVDSMYVLRVAIEQKKDNSLVFVAIMLSVALITVGGVVLYKRKTRVVEFVTSDVFELE